MTPYALGTPARDSEFYGRHLETEALLSHRWTWLCAQRRVGKTSLLYRVEAEAKVQGSIPLFFDLTWVPGTQATGNELFQRFFRRNNGARGPLAEFKLELSDFAAFDPAERFRVLVERLQERGREVFFLWDEAERLIDVETNDPGFLEELRGQLHDLRGFSFVLASTQLLSELFGRPGRVSSFLATFSWFPLASLRTEDAIALLEARQTGSWSHSLPSVIIDRALDWSGGHPLMLAELAAQLGLRSSFDGSQVDDTTFTASRDHLIANHSLKAIVSDDFTKLTEPQRELLRLLCMSEACRSLDDVAAASGEDLASLQDAARFLVSYGYISTDQCRRLRYGFYRDMLPRHADQSAADTGKVGRITSQSIFISYSHSDLHYCTELKKSLELLARQRNIEVWDDRRIEVGTHWNTEIERALERASVAVLIISDDFLQSHFITETELPILLSAASRGICKILCLHARPSLADEVLFDIGGEHRPLTTFQALNSPDRPLSGLDDDEREAEIVGIVREIVRLCA